MCIRDRRCSPGYGNPFTYGPVLDPLTGNETHAGAWVSFRLPESGRARPVLVCSARRRSPSLGRAGGTARAEWTAPAPRFQGDGDFRGAGTDIARAVQPSETQQQPAMSRHGIALVPVRDQGSAMALEGAVQLDDNAV